MFTRNYAAPEALDWDKRGFSADIFSLGCVFVEIAAALALMYAYSGRNSHPEDFMEKLDALIADGGASYQASIPGVQDFTQGLRARENHALLPSISPEIRRCNDLSDVEPQSGKSPNCSHSCCVFRQPGSMLLGGRYAGSSRGIST